MKLNTSIKSEPVYTHEGRGENIPLYLQLRRSVMANLLWEDNAYESGEKVVDRIATLVPQVKPAAVADLAIEARTAMKLRHVPLLLCCEMAKHESHRGLVANTLTEVIQRPDELAETLAIYWRNGKSPIAHSIRQGLAKAFTKFDEYSLSKYNRDGAIKLRDVLFLSHAKPLNKGQDNLWKKLINNELKTPDTWEVELSKGGDKLKGWTRLLEENKLGALALIRNLRNFKEAGVNEKLIVNALDTMKVERVLPFRFISAAKYYPALEENLQNAMYKCLDGIKLKGKTALIVDTSPSMWGHRISAKSELNRFDAAAALAILLREVCQDVRVYTFNKKAYEIPNRRGFALRDVLSATKDEFSCGSLAVDLANNVGYDRIICLTDGQWHAVDANNRPTHNMSDSIDYAPLKDSRAYMLNVANNQNGIGYRKGWINLDGFSENLINYIVEIEKE